MTKPDLPAGLPADTRTIYWIMYSENVPVNGWDSGEVETRSRQQHCGTSDFDSAMKTVLEFRDTASKGGHFIRDLNQHPNACLNAAWIEVEHRYRLEA